MQAGKRCQFRFDNPTVQNLYNNLHQAAENEEASTWTWTLGMLVMIAAWTKHRTPMLKDKWFVYLITNRVCLTVLELVSLVALFLALPQWLRNKWPQHWWFHTSTPTNPMKYFVMEMFGDLVLGHVSRNHTEYNSLEAWFANLDFSAQLRVLAFVIYIGKDNMATVVDNVREVQVFNASSKRAVKITETVCHPWFSVVIHSVTMVIFCKYLYPTRDYRSLVARSVHLLFALGLDWFHVCGSRWMKTYHPWVHNAQTTSYWLIAVIATPVLSCGASVGTVVDAKGMALMQGFVIVTMLAARKLIGISAISQEAHIALVALVLSLVISLVGIAVLCAIVLYIHWNSLLGQLCFIAFFVSLGACFHMWNSTSNREDHHLLGSAGEFVKNLSNNYSWVRHVVKWCLPMAALLYVSCSYVQPCLGGSTIHHTDAGSAGVPSDWVLNVTVNNTQIVFEYDLNGANGENAYLCFKSFDDSLSIPNTIYCDAAGTATEITASGSGSHVVCTSSNPIADGVNLNWTNPKDSHLIVKACIDNNRSFTAFAGKSLHLKNFKNLKNPENLENDSKKQDGISESKPDQGSWDAKYLAVMNTLVAWLFPTDPSDSGISTTPVSQPPSPPPTPSDNKGPPPPPSDNKGPPPPPSDNKGSINIRWIGYIVVLYLSCGGRTCNNIWTTFLFVLSMFFPDITSRLKSLLLQKNKQQTGIEQHQKGIRDGRAADGCRTGRLVERAACGVWTRLIACCTMVYMMTYIVSLSSKNIDLVIHRDTQLYLKYWILPFVLGWCSFMRGVNWQVILFTPE